MKSIIRKSGFILIEALVMTVILSVTFVAFFGILSQCLKVSSRSHETTQAIAKYEYMVFELESGLRSDLVMYGGQEELEDGYSYDIEAKDEISSSHIKARISWGGEKDFIQNEFIVLQAPVQ